MTVALWIVLAVAVTALGIIAQSYRIQRDQLIELVNLQFTWIDEIIAALEDANEEAGNESLDHLLDGGSKWGRALSSGSSRWRRQ